MNILMRGDGCLFLSAIDYEGGDQTRVSLLINAQFMHIQKEVGGFGERKIVGKEQNMY